ncbi:ABC transporter permease [Thioclava dalianensis]|uniref:ABC transporter permease n=1 Tax=Thioclava dalianensis TaxID=1185766 RepID=A0A074THH6_9RHOB|nr:branched-chain amino acid ABC transporter permease [Thioclava dalianensis]KEP71151.1 ABC transporter permease [Thioclava dalianensis]SFN23892.1 branched-chain amino acid transport system permease protein [Thioclava dalianensis]
MMPNRHARAALLGDYLPGVAICGALLAGLIWLPSDNRLPMEILLVFAMAQGWNLLSGYAGLLSFGHQVFIGIGAYSLFMSMNAFGLPLPLALGVAGLVTMATAAVMALFLHRMRDAYFSIGIWVMADCVRLLIGQWDWVGSSRGVMLESSKLDLTHFADMVFWLAIGLAVVVQFGVFILLRSRFGLGLMATRDNDVAAASVGIGASRSKVTALILSALICGLGGAVYYLSILYADPSGAFDLSWQIKILFIVIIGGVGTLEGPILGTALYFVLQQAFQDNGEMFLLLQGLTAIVVMVFAPQGIWGVIAQRTGLQIFPTRRRPPGPSLAARRPKPTTEDKAQAARAPAKG